MPCATPGRGANHLSLRRPGDFVTLEIEDSGIGITEEQAASCSNASTVSTAPALKPGLGLAIVREISELHHANASLRPNSHGRGRCPGRFPALSGAPAPPGIRCPGREGEPGLRNPPTGFV